MSSILHVKDFFFHILQPKQYTTTDNAEADVRTQLSSTKPEINRDLQKCETMTLLS